MSPTDNHDVLRRLIGTWRLRSFSMKTADGQITYPFGRDAIGYYILAEGGYMSVAIMTAHRARFAAGDILGGSPEEKVGAAETYISYCGKYEIQGDRLIVHPEVSFFPNWIGVDQVRLLEITDDTLTLRTSPIPLRGIQQTALLVWERV